MGFVYNDGGRKGAGLLGKSGDCVTRAIAIASETPYEDVFLELCDRHENLHLIRERKSSVQNGCSKKAYHPYLLQRGWRWVPTMQIGKGCTVHLKASELPSGRLICRVSKHLVAVIDGVIHDTHDCSREGTRCVYGYYVRENR